MGEIKKITIDVLFSPGCHVCKLFEEFWHSIEAAWPSVTFRVLDVTTSEGQEFAQKYTIFASPGIIINGELWATGGFDKEKFIKKLKELSQ